VIERNGSECKYVEIFTHRAGSIGAPSRRTVFVKGTTITIIFPLAQIRVVDRK
jgi:hypothetical protein